MTPSVDSKLPRAGTTIFTVISQLAQECNAINLGQGFPDFDGSEQLRELACRYIRDGHNQYSPMAGMPKLRQQIANKVARLYHYQVCPDTEVTITPGATEGIFCAIIATVRPGDEVIVFDPAYDCYDPAVELAGGKAVHIPLQPPAFGIDWQRVKETINSKTRMIVINTPHNPSGALLSREDLNQLAAVVRDTPILVLADEVYEHLVFDGKRHHSVLAHPELAERAFAVFSFGKTYHVTGWKTGYCVAPSVLTSELRKVHQFVTFVGVTPIQCALADFMESTPDYYLELADFYQRKRDLFCKALQESLFTFTPSPGTYFQLVDYSAISDRNDVDMAQWLTRKHGVAAIPVSVFCQQPLEQRHVRFCFAKQDSTLLEAAQRLVAINN